MPKPYEKVEIGFDLTDNDSGLYFVLDDATAGQLDNPNYVLSGTIYIDVTERVKAIGTRRGKSRQLDRYAAGQATVIFDNSDRAFDPTYADSPFYGQVIPRRKIRISAGTAVQFYGSIDDWNLDYSPMGENLASAVASDDLRTLANQTLSFATATVQTSGERINAILDNADVDWPATARNIDTGAQVLGADVIEDDTNALSYLQLVEASEPGALFVSKSGDLTFQDRTVAPNSNSLVLADDGSGIRYTGMKVVYGSELLYNEIVISSAITNGTAIANDVVSQGVYDIQNLTQTDLLMSTDVAVQELADWYASKYANPEFRFESVEVILNDLTPEQQQSVLDLELGSVVKIVFTPGNPPIAPAIEKYAEVIRMDSTSDKVIYQVSLGFSTLDFASLVLDDLVFGRLDEGNALSF